MILKPLRFGQKAILVLLESLMILLVLGGIAVAGLAWRVSQGPLEIGFAKKFIESELSNSAENMELKVGQIFLAWSPQERRPEVTLKNVKLFSTDQNRLAFAFESAEVSFSRVALLVGHIEPRSVVIDRPLIRLVRDTNNHVRLALDQKPTADKDHKSIDVFEVLDQLSRSSRDTPHGSPLRALHMIAINDARMMVEDHVLGQSWLVPKIDLAMRRSDQGLAVQAGLWLESARTAQPTLRAEAVYLPESRAIAVDAALKGLTTGFLATRFPNLEWLKDQNVMLDGQAQARIDSTMALTDLKAGLQSVNGQIMIPDVHDRPAPYKSLALNMLYSRAQKTFTLEESPIAFTDDFTLSVSGSLSETAAGQFTAPFRIYIDSLPQARVAEYWPAILRGDPSEEWALKRMADGRLIDSTVDIVLAVAQKDLPEDPARKDWSVDLADLKSDFGFEGMTVDYREPLMPVKNAKGRGQYDYRSDRLTVDVTSAKLGDLDIDSGKVVVDVVAGKAVGHASIDIDARGPLRSLFRYLAEDPINVNFPADIDKVEGVTKLKINVSFPTLAVLPAEKIDVTAEGSVDKVLLPGLVHDLDVTGGPMTVKVKDKRVAVEGKAALDGHDTDFTFDQFFESKGNPYSGQVIASLVIDDALRRKFTADLEDWIQGPVSSRVTYTDFGGGRAEIAIDADAKAASLLVKPMNYTKAPGVAARVKALALLDHNELMGVRDLSVEAPDVKVDGAELTFAQSGQDSLLRKGSFPRVRLLESDVALSFDIPASKQVNLTVKGAFADASPFLDSDKPPEVYTGPAMTVNASVQKMRTSKTHVIDDARADFVMDREGLMERLEFDARVGQGSMSYRYSPDPAGQKMILTIDAEDAGATLDAFGVYENARGGSLSVTAQSTPGGDPHILAGTGEILNFKVVKAPVLARLVNALSLPGILQLLGSDGISFARLESGFTWTKDKNTDLFILKDGRTSGSSMGLTFEGSVDGITDTIMVNGAIVPVTLVNDMIGGIPLIGDILSGGSKGGVFAATYSVKGPTENPTTTVNPLAVLAPGFLRRIFFE